MLITEEAVIEYLENDQDSLDKIVDAAVEKARIHPEQVKPELIPQAIYGTWRNKALEILRASFSDEDKQKPPTKPESEEELRKIVARVTSLLETIKNKFDQKFAEATKIREQAKKFLDDHFEAAVEEYFAKSEVKPTKWESKQTQDVLLSLRTNLRKQIDLKVLPAAALKPIIGNLDLMQKIAIKGDYLIGTQPPKPEGASPAAQTPLSPTEATKKFLDDNLKIVLENYPSDRSITPWDDNHTEAIQKILRILVRNKLKMPETGLSEAELTTLLTDTEFVKKITDNAPLLVKNPPPKSEKKPEEEPPVAQESLTPEQKAAKAFINNRFDEIMVRYFQNISPEKKLKLTQWDKEQEGEQNPNTFDIIALLNQQVRLDIEQSKQSELEVKKEDLAKVNLLALLKDTAFVKKIRIAGETLIATPPPKPVTTSEPPAEPVQPPASAHAAAQAHAAAPAQSPAPAAQSPAPEQPVESDEELARRLDAEEQAKRRPRPEEAGDEELARRLAAGEGTPPSTPAAPTRQPAQPIRQQPLVQQPVRPPVQQPTRPPVQQPTEDEQLRAVLAASEASAKAEEEARRLVAQLNNNPTPPHPTAPVPTPPPAGPAPISIPTPQLSSIPSAPTTYGKILLYISGMGAEDTLSHGTFYGRSNRFDKKKLAEETTAILNNSNMSERDKFMALQTAILKNREYTGNPLFHRNHEGSLDRLLRGASEEILQELKKQPYQAPLARLDGYIAAAKAMQLNSGKSIGSFVIKSNQVDKLKLAESVKNTFAALNAASSQEQLEAVKKQIDLDIKENIKLTGDNFLHKHGKGKLHDILAELESEVNARLAPRLGS